MKTKWVCDEEQKKKKKRRKKELQQRPNGFCDEEQKKKRKKKERKKELNGVERKKKEKWRRKPLKRPLKAAPHVYCFDCGSRYVGLIMKMPLETKGMFGNYFFPLFSISKNKFIFLRLKNLFGNPK